MCVYVLQVCSGESSDWGCWQLDTGKRRTAAALQASGAECEELALGAKRTMCPAAAVLGGPRV